MSRVAVSHTGGMQGWERRFRVLAAVAVLVVFAAAGCGDDNTPTAERHRQIVQVKYRSDPVDVGNPAFESLKRNDSSVVRAAWFDVDSGYLVINLTGTNYHYCAVPVRLWDALLDAPSLGEFYNAVLKGSYDCRRAGTIPDY